MARGIGFSLKLAAVVIAAATAASAATPTAWFATATPPGLQNPPQLASIGNPVRAPAFKLPAGQTAEPEFAGSRIQRDLRAIVGFSDAMEATGVQFWGRIAGYPSETAAANWFAAQLRSAGVKSVEVQTFDAAQPFWRPKTWEVRILADPAFGPGSADVILRSAVPTSGSKIDGAINAPLVFAGEAGDPVRVDVRGKIAIQHSRPTTGAYSDRSKIVQSTQALEAAGAVAVFNWVEQEGNMHVFDFASRGKPAFNLGGADGAFLKAVLGKAGARPVNARLTLDSEMATGLKAQNVIGVVPGLSTESVIVNAHLDSWFDGAGDNGDGVAVALALARHYAKAAAKPAKTLIFVGNAGHHSPGMNGATNLVRMNRPLLNTAVLVLNLEHVAQYQVRTDPWRVDPTEEPKNVGVSNMNLFLIDKITAAAARYGYTYNTMIDASVPGDLGGYAPLGVARVQGIHSGPLYHTSGDVVGSISVPGLERAAYFYRDFIDAVLAAPASLVNPPAAAK